MKKENIQANRYDEILDIAEKLFFTKGFDNTSTNEIIQAVGIAKGTLYYYFTSKEEIMNAIIDRTSDQLILRAKKIAEDKSIKVVDRLIKAIKNLNVDGPAGQEIVSQLNKPQNALMHDKVRKMLITDVTPIIANIVEDGIEEGVFSTPYPYETVEMILAYAHQAFNGEMFDLNNKSLTVHIQAFIHNVMLLLGDKEEALNKLIEVFI